MYSKLLKSCRAIKHAWNWVRALNFAEDLDFDNCAFVLESLIGNHPPNFSVYLLHAFVCKELGRNKDAAKSLLEFEERLDKTKRYSSEEKNYLFVYASFIARHVASSSAEVNFLDLRGDIESINFSAIRKSILNNFPLKATDNKSFKNAPSGRDALTGAP